jgi:hypothetical protein
MTRDIRISRQDNGYLVIADPDYETPTEVGRNETSLHEPLREKRMVFNSFNEVIVFIRLQYGLEV